MKVFLVICHDIEWDTVHAIFTNEDRANKLAQEVGADVEEWELDPPDSAFARFDAYCCGRSIAGMECHSNRISAVPMDNIHNRVSCAGPTWVNVTAYGPTEQEAKNAAKELFLSTAKEHNLIAG